MGDGASAVHAKNNSVVHADDAAAADDADDDDDDGDGDGDDDGTRTRPTFVAYCFAVPRVAGGTLIGISPLCSYDGDDGDGDDDDDGKVAVPVCAQEHERYHPAPPHPTGN